MTTKGIRHLVALGMLVVLIISLAVWFFRRDRLPRTVRLATGDTEGLYYLVGSEIMDSLGRRLHREISIKPTAGSLENLDLLVRGEVDLAIVQGGTVAMEDVSVVTPLYPELLLVIVRKGRDITSIPDLKGKNVALGKEGSGNRNSSLKVLKHFGISLEEVGNNHFSLKEFEDDSTMDAALVIAGIAHPRLRKLLASNEFELLPIDSAPAIDLVNPFLRNDRIPRGLFAEQPPVPSESIPTIATTAYLVARNDAPDHLVRAAVAAVHEENLRLTVPTLIPRKEVSAWITSKMHPVAHLYFNPSDNIGMMTGVMESLVATKELLFSIGAGLYLLWHRWRRLKEREIEDSINRQKEHLDRILEKTLQIEEAQMETANVEELQTFLDQVTRIKLDALHEFTAEELRGDQSFSIFLTQCANLINKIQLKIISHTSSN